MNIGCVAPIGDLPPSAIRELATAADTLGYDTLWVAEGYTFDAVSTLGWLAAQTTRIRLATGVINVFSRSPSLIGQTAAALDRLSNGRFVLGLGVSGPQVVAGWFGVPFDRPLTRLRETVEIVRRVVAREPLRYAGRVFTMDMGLKLVNRPERRRLPIYLASISPGGVRLAAEIADGWLPAFFAPAHAGVFAEDLARGRGARSDPLDPLRVCAYLTVVVDDDVAAARDAARRQLALYLGGMGSRAKNFYNELFCRYGYAEEARAVQRHFLEGRRDEALRAVSDAMVDAVSACGPAARCREKIAELAAAGVEDVALVVQFSRDPVAALRALASQVVAYRSSPGQGDALQ